MEQRSDEWFQARLGKVTASRVADIMATLKTGKEAITRKNYRIQLVSERLTGKKVDLYFNDAMRVGIEREEDARTTYMFKHSDVEEVGFIDHPTISMTGASPDGLVGEDGLIEIKCPLATTHTDTIISGEAPSKYISQMQWQMACTGRKWCDFVSFNPDFPENLQLFVVRVERDDTLIKELEDGVKKFLSEVDDTINQLQEKK
jgi:putative phage-type endonuclease